MTLLTLVILGVIFINLMPKPIDMNLEKIGNGQESVVFIYDPNLLVSNQQATEINRAREIISKKINFLIAKAGDPNSRDFREHYRASSAELFFFDGDGELIHRQLALINAEEFMKILSDR